jgi:hypothetical protein
MKTKKRQIILKLIEDSPVLDGNVKLIKYEDFRKVGLCNTRIVTNNSKSEYFPDAHFAKRIARELGYKATVSLYLTIEL